MVLLAALTLGAAAHATTLKELLDQADKNNVDWQISQEQRRKAANEFGQAWSGLLPGVTVQGGWTNNEYPAVVNLPTGDPTNPVVKLTITPKDQFDGVVRVDMPLIDVSRWFRTAALAALDHAAEHRMELMRDNVHRQVALTYYGLAASQAFRESAKRSLSVAQAQANLQEIRLKAGAATELEVLRSRAEVQRNKQILADTESAIANTHRSLRTLTGVTLADKASLPQDDLRLDGSLETLEDKSQNVPAVRAAESEALAAGRVATASGTQLIPSFTANFTERLTNATGFIGRANSYTAGVGFVWRLDGPTLFGIGAQSASAGVARLALERQKLASRDQVHQEFQRLRAAVEKVTAAQAQVQSAQRAAQVSRDRYAVGAATQLDVITAERDLFNAEVSQIQARTELATSHVSLRISAGLPLNVQ
ncbi:MAG: TolC family protein [Myxococcaceae bacterium]